MSLFDKRKIFTYTAKKKAEKKPIWLPYLKSDGHQYIQDDYLFKNDTLAVSGSFIVDEILSSKAVFGWQGRDDYLGTLLLRNTSRADVFPAGISVEYQVGLNHFTFQTSPTQSQLEINGKTSTVQKSFNISKTTSYVIFGNKSTTNFVGVQAFTGAICSIQFYDNNQLVRNFRPCLNPETLQPAMYDTVNEQYYYNQGTGEFQYDLNFVELDYIEGDGHQYINTGVTGTGDSLAYSIKMKLNTPQIYGYPILYGSRSNEGSTNRFYVATNNFLDRMYIGDGNNEHAERPSNLNTDLSDKNIFKYNLDNDNWLYCNDTKVVQLDAQFDVYSICLLTCNFEGRTDDSSLTRSVVGQLYSSQIKNNNILVRDYIPCRMNDGQIGMWDFVTGKFYGNSGAGKFKGYIGNKQVGKSLKGDGMAFLKIGVSPTENTSIKVLWSSDTLASGNLYGSFSPNSSPKLQNRFQMVFGRDKKIYIGYGATNTVLQSNSYCNGEVNDFYLDAIKKQFSGNGVVLDTALDPVDLNKHKNMPMYLFDTNQGLMTTPTTANIYYFFLKEKDKIIMELIPVKVNDSIIGMLDVISGKIFINDGTGEFGFVE